MTALDLTPGLLETGRKRGKAARLEITWVEGDAEALPFDAGAFEIVKTRAEEAVAEFKAAAEKAAL